MARRWAQAIQARGPRKDMRRKSAFNQGHFWENIGMFLFMAAGLVGLWYVMTNVISW
jgi:hypothetical protein